MFLLVKLTFLGEQNFNLGLYSINFWSQRSNSIIKRWFFEFLHRNKSPNNVEIDIVKLSSMRSFDWCTNCDVLKRKIIFYIFTYGLWPKFSKFVFHFKTSKFIHQSKDLVELKNICFDLIWTFIPIQNFKKPPFNNRIRPLRSKTYRIKT